MVKEIFNLLSSTAISNKNIALSSTGAYTFCDSIYCPRADSGILYIRVSGFDDANAGLNLRLYNSYNDAQYFLATSMAYDSAAGVALQLDNIGKYMRLAYNLEAASLDNALIMFEAHSEL